MNVVVLSIACVTLLILAALVWLAGKPLSEETSLRFGSRIEDLVPLHTQHFPQLRQALESADNRFVRQKVHSRFLRAWQAERRQILRSFLRGLAEDFARLTRLAQIVTSLNPRFSRRRELERVWLSLRFRLAYRIVVIWISVGGAGSARQLRYLTELVGSLSARAEAGMIRLEGRSPA